MSSSRLPSIDSKKRMIQALIEKSKYLDDENFLKPVKKKKKKQSKQSKSKTKRMRRISYSEYQRLLVLTKQKSASRPLRRGKDDKTPEWAKLARVSSIPNR